MPTYVSISETSQAVSQANAETQDQKTLSWCQGRYPEANRLG